MHDCMDAFGDLDAFLSPALYKRKEKKISAKNCLKEKSLDQFVSLAKRELDIFTARC